MTTQTDLIRVPTFTFNQGDIYEMEDETERPISIDFYGGSITLRQEGQYDKEEEVLISPKYFEALFKAIQKNLAEVNKINKFKEQ